MTPVSCYRPARVDINTTIALLRSCHGDHFLSSWTCDCFWLAIKSKEEQAVLLEVIWWHHEGNVGAKCADATRGRPAPCLVPSPWCHSGATAVPGAIIVVIGINTWNKSGLPPLG